MSKKSVSSPDTSGDRANCSHRVGTIISRGQTCSGGSNGSMRICKRRTCLILGGGGVHEKMLFPKK